LRLVGFKSFAERTTVEFGPGISAIVGPNGSGKSNLADALRWALGEQGRSLRTRRSEDLIFAGSSSRRAIGMADVTLVLDNEDRLLPVDFGEIELGRRLYRSGENEYLLNRERIRLRDLVDLLDEANLADNAFLFIGQGMVDQALSLRPEERRSLFEEAAGIRKHDRRRRAAEASLAEAHANLERVRDLLGELRPLRRRLAAQAEQQAERQSAGSALSHALVDAARVRLAGLARQSRDQGAALEVARRSGEAALAQLRDTEAQILTLSGAISERVEAEAAARDAYEAARSRVVALQVERTRLDAEARGLTADLQRIRDELAVIEQRTRESGRELAVAVPDLDPTEAGALDEAERRLAQARRELSELHDMGRAEAERTRSAREAREAAVAERDRATWRAREADRRLSEHEAQHAAAMEREVERERVHQDAIATATRAARDEAESERAFETARATVIDREALVAEHVRRLDALRSERSALGARAAILDQRLGTRDAGGTAETGAQVQARRLADGLEVEPRLRPAVEAALADALGALVVGEDAVLAHGVEPATYLLEDEPSRSTARERAGQAIVDQAVALGGGPLAAAVLADPGGHATRLLSRVVWVPERRMALEVRPQLPSGWRTVTPAGDVVADEGLVRIGLADPVLAARAERAEIARSLERVAGLITAADADAADSRTELEAARGLVAEARQRAEDARRARRAAGEAERGAGAALETAAREVAWANAHLERLRAEATDAASNLASRSEEVSAWEPGSGRTGSADPSRDAQIAALEKRIALLTRERDERAAAVDQARRKRDDALDLRRRAEVRVALDSNRAEALNRDLAQGVERESELAARREATRVELAAAERTQADCVDALARLEAVSRDARTELVAAEAQASGIRERLRAAEQQARAVEVAEMEARVQLEAGREGLLVELASIGADGLAALQTESQPEPAGVPADLSGDDFGPALEAALDQALARWQTGAGTEPTAEPPAPSPGRLAALRRRYHELGAGNPFAADELAEVTERLDALETQHADLERAIASTRELIARLEQHISDQFRQTFSALEDAFGRRFRQLFGGGEAELSLTAPDDLSATGVEITARPPGKKRQPLAMLSGGERALTAVALLLAMLEVRPVPFCVLDEVDAALDEANVGRFASALRGLAETIQFVVITHNRGTIEASDALYGVTVDDDAVSRVVSLRLADLEREPVAIPVSA
jgi:chromosome segregation protein